MARASSQPSRCRRASFLFPRARRILLSTNIAHQSRPSSSSAISATPSGMSASVFVKRSVRTATMSARGCASITLVAMGRAKRSTQFDARGASTCIFLSSFPDGRNEFMPEFPAAQAMNRQITGIRRHFVVWISRQREVNRRPVRTQGKQAVNGCLAQRSRRPDQDNRRSQREGQSLSLNERVHRRTKVGDESTESGQETFALLPAAIKRDAHPQ